MSHFSVGAILLPHFSRHEVSLRLLLGTNVLWVKLPKLARTIIWALRKTTVKQYNTEELYGMECWECLTLDLWTQLLCLERKEKGREDGAKCVAHLLSYFAMLLAPRTRTTSSPSFPASPPLLLRNGSRGSPRGKPRLAGVKSGSCSALAELRQTRRVPPSWRRTWGGRVRGGGREEKGERMSDTWYDNKLSVLTSRSVV